MLTYLHILEQSLLLHSELLIILIEYCVNVTTRKNIRTISDRLVLKGSGDARSKGGCSQIPEEKP